MPPFGYRKRERAASPPPSKPAKRKATSSPQNSTPKKTKSNLFDTVDAPSANRKNVEDNKKFLQDLDDEDDESLSDVESDEFEDIPAAKRRKTSPAKHEDAEDEGDEDEMDWEDSIQPEPSSSHVTTPAAVSRNVDDDEIGDVSVSLNEDGSYIEPVISAGTNKKGPTKRERQTRVQTHCLHVMSLMWHNSVRNSWLNDKEVQKILVDGLPDGVRKEVQRWKKSMGTLGGDSVQPKAKETPSKGKGKGKRGKNNDKADGRDWNSAAEAQDADTVQTTQALLRLLKVLTAYWRKRFDVTAPGFRKQGYKDLRRLRNEIQGWEKDHKNLEHGERIESVQEFRKLAKKCEGSRDVGGQLFVALLRGLGLEARMVANLQPAGFGWSKAEEADPKKPKKEDDKPAEADSESDDDIDEPKTANAKMGASSSAKKPKPTLKKEKPTRKSSRGNKTDPINLDESDSPLSEPPSEVEELDEDGDDLSVIDITPPTPKKKSSKKYDRDLAFPLYWTEVCDPVSHKYFPVDPIVLSTIASNDELLQAFEPRGKKAENSKQVICYTIAFSADGTAKDVTVRYLKRHQIPGKTKGMRMPLERIPIYNRRGKVRKYENYNWFRTLISLYDRLESKRTAADDLEEQTDLKPFKPVKEEKHVEKESLQGYRQSADFVLEQHLRREEAVKPGAKPVKTFTAGKSDKTVEHPVYLRSDILVCKTVESWHKDGRAIKVGEQPVKYVPMRAVTLIKKREMEDAQRETGEKLKQGLYSEDQTDWIIPPPIQNGVIPRNAFGNMDVYVPTMVPAGAVHLPLKGTAKLCRKLEIDYAEACTGFEFGKQRAVPVLTGVVVAEEHELLVRDAWRAEQQEIKRKEDTKRTAAALHWWRKMLLGLRVLERMRTEYEGAGGKEEEINPFVAKAKREGRGKETMDVDVDVDAHEDLNAGGFFVPGHHEEEVPQSKAHAHGQAPEISGGFVMEDDDDESAAGAGGFLVEDGPDNATASMLPKNHTPITPVSLQSMHKTDAAAHSKPDEDRLSQPVALKHQGRRRQSAVRTARSKKPRTDSEGDESSLSGLAESGLNDEDDSSSNVEDLSNNAFTPPRSDYMPNRKVASPQVVISPPKKKTTTPSSGGRRRSARAVKKGTPVRSPYFTHSDEGEDSEEEVSTDDEVVKPRKTTARTKARG